MFLYLQFEIEWVLKCGSNNTSLSFDFKVQNMPTCYTYSTISLLHKLDSLLSKQIFTPHAHARAGVIDRC